MVCLPHFGCDRRCVIDAIGPRIVTARRHHAPQCELSEISHFEIAIRTIEPTRCNRTYYEPWIRLLHLAIEQGSLCNIDGLAGIDNHIGSHRESCEGLARIRMID